MHVFYCGQKDDSHMSAIVRTMSSMRSEPFKKENILLSVELKVYCK